MSKLSQSLHPPYHLRPNKAIDRAIFIELLRVYNNYHLLNKHLYIGFGGPYLEDFRMLAKIFPNIQMVLVERDEETFKRQQFHLCSKNIQPFNCQFENFLSTEFPSNKPTITWLDYTKFEKQCLLEVGAVSRMCIPQSILKVSVPAETPLYYKLKLGKRRPVEMPSGLNEAFNQFVENYQRNLKIDDISFSERIFNWSNFTEKNYSSLIAGLLHSVIVASSESSKTCLPLHTVEYSDGTIMLSTTYLFCKEEELESLTSHFQSRCEFFSPEAASVQTIDVPMLTTKERLHLESFLPVERMNGEVTSKELGYDIEGSNAKDLSKYKMRQYEKYHRLYPYFGKLIP